MPRDERLLKIENKLNDEILAGHVGANVKNDLNEYGMEWSLITKDKNIGKEALKFANEPLKVTTRSDLIGHNDYIEQLPKGSAIEFVLTSFKDELPRQITPRAASSERMLNAGMKLKNAGYDVKFVFQKIKNVNSNEQVPPDFAKAWREKTGSILPIEFVDADQALVKQAKERLKKQ